MLPFGLSAAVSTTDAAIQKNIYESGTAALIISNDEVEVIMKIVKLLEKLRILIKRISETINNEGKVQKGGFLPMLLGALVASLLESAVPVQGVIKAGEGTIRSGQNF